MTKKELIAKQQAIVDAAKNAGRALTAEEQQEFENLQRSLENMPDDKPEAGNAPDAAGGSGNNGGVKDLSPEEAAQRAIADERKRIADISALCRSFGMQPDEYISGGQSMDQVRCAVLEKMQKDGAPINVRVYGCAGVKSWCPGSEASRRCRRTPRNVSARSGCRMSCSGRRRCKKPDPHERG